MRMRLVYPREYGKNMMTGLSPHNGFSLIELTVTVAIIGILAVVAFPSFQSSLIRSKLMQVKVDFFRIKTAYEMYYIDHNDYPNTRIDDPHLFGMIQIQNAINLYKPINYLNPVPEFPWRVRTSDYSYSTKPNYLVETLKDNNGYISNEANWFIASGGPVSTTFCNDTPCWYSPTNGLLSIGGFWLDSSGKSSFGG